MDFGELYVSLGNSEKEQLPFLKWAGGKRWLTKLGVNFQSIQFQRYIEPFLGSGAVFFHLNPQNAVLSDLNVRLVETYTAVRNDHAAVEKELRSHARNHSKEYYYAERARKRRNEYTRAAQFIYLNRVCFNGIYRENLRGEFNVPIGTKQRVLLDTDNFSAVAERLSRAKLLATDFETTVDLSEEGDFLYIDPPYTTAHNKNGFVKYNQKIFKWEDQVRLASSLARAHERGAKIVVSNADHHSVRELYESFLDMVSLSRFTGIGSKAGYRSKTTEILASNVL